MLQQCSKTKGCLAYFMLPRMWESVRGWTSTLPSELPFWELESRWTPRWTLKFLESNCKGPNPLDRRAPYIIGKLLERRCLKWFRITHLDTSHVSYDQKKGRKSNCEIDSRPLNIRKHPNFLVCRWFAIYHWKAFNEGYNFASDLISIGGFHTKLWAPKVVRVLTMGILGLPLGSLETKWHLGWPVARHKVYYKGEGGGFPQVRVCSWFVRAPKCSNYTLTNLLFGLCNSVWVIELLLNFLNPIPEI